MKAVLLAGGLGTRFSEETDVRPKPMIEIGGKPILWHIMKGYAKHGFKDFVLCLGYKGWLIKDFFLNYQRMSSDLLVTLGPGGTTELLGPALDEDWRVILADTGEATMTGGRLAAVRKHVEMDDLVMFTYGDGVADIDVNRLVDFHRGHGKIATVTAVRPPGRFGELSVAAGTVAEFNEKPQAAGGLINGGFFVFDARRIWDYVKPDPACILEAEPMRALVRDRQLVAYEHAGFWQPMDTLRELNMLNDLWSSGRAPWKVWE
jgi:glucose-1-phosphate cytidylyltransferase